MPMWASTATWRRTCMHVRMRGWRRRVRRGSTAAVPTGIAMEFPPTHGALVEDRSGLAVRGVTTLAGVIDPGYRGEIRVVMTNLNAAPVEIKAGDRIAQLRIVSGSRRASRRLRSWARRQEARGDLGVRGSDEPTSQNQDVGHPARKNLMCVHKCVLCM